jgi:hypothetical protein
MKKVKNFFGKNTYRMVGLFLFIVFMGLWGEAQTSTATLRGSVSDGTEKVVPNAIIKLTRNLTNQAKTFVTDANGQFSFTFLEPGTYTLEVNAEGFKSYQRKDLVLEVGQTAEISVALAIGLKEEVVVVEGGTLQLEESTGTLGGVVEQRRIESLPLNGRNVLQLSSLEAGVVGTSATRQANPPVTSQASFSVSGGRALTNEILFDGATITSKSDNLPAFRPSPDTIQEFRISTNSYSAEIGRSGGGAISFVTRSGGKDFRGTLWEYFRNDALDANNFFANKTGVGKQKLRFNQFGGNISGPVILPRFGEGGSLFFKPKAFFFFNYEALRSSSSLPQSGIVPTARMRTGDFGELLGLSLFSTAANCGGAVSTTTSAFPCNVVDTSGATVQARVGMIYQVVGTTRRAYAGNIIPTVSQNPVGRALLNYYPLPNGSLVLNANGTLGNNYFTSENQSSSNNQIVARLDYSISNNQQIYGRIISEFNSGKAEGSFPGLVSSRSGSSNTSSRPQSIALDYVNNLTGTSVLRLNVGWTRLNLENLTFSNGFNLNLINYPANIINASGDSNVFPTIAPTGYSPLGSARNFGNLKNTQDTFSFSADYNLVVGSHSFKMGANQRYYTIYNTRPDDPTGNFTFVRASTARAATDTLSGDTIAGLLLGVPNTGRLGIAPRPAVVSRYTAFYFQDDWIVNKRLTLNLGLRYEIDFPVTDRYDALTNFRPELNFPVPSITIPITNSTGGALPTGVAGLVRSLRGQVTSVNDSNDSAGEQQNRDLNNFAPRIGFALKLTDKTVLRGGGGIFYSSATGGGLTAPAFAYGNLSETPYVAGTGVTLSNPFPNGIVQPGAVTPFFGYGQASVPARVRDIVQPQIIQWNLSLQRQLPYRIFVETSYTGSSGSFILGGTTDLNQLSPEALALGATVLDTAVNNPFLTLPVDQRPSATSILGRPTVTVGQLLRPFPQFGNIVSFFPNDAHSTYHAGLFKVGRRVGDDLTFQVSYTFSKLIDNISGIQATGIGVQVPNYQNANNRSLDKSLSTFDFRNIFVANSSYNLPFGKGKTFLKEGALSKIFGGFGLNFITQFQNGSPLAILQANNALQGLAYIQQRPNLTGSPVLRAGEQTIDRWFNTAAFALTPNYQFGNTPRTLNLRAPSYFSTNISLQRNFQLQEQIGMQFRAEAFNVFNRANFGLPGTVFGGANFGVVTTAEDPRQIQFAVRLMFK